MRQTNQQDLIERVKPKYATQTLPHPYQMLNTRHGLFIINENDCYIGQSFIHYGEYSHQEWLLLQAIVDNNAGDVIEVGANIGSHTLPLAKQAAKHGYELYAFEPQAIIHQQLAANLSINAIFNAYTYPYACGQTQQTVSFPVLNPLTNNNFGGIGFDTLHQFNPAQTKPVQMIVLDEMLGHLKKIGLLKIDVEGFELEVLKGAQNILKNQRPILYLENDQVDKSDDLIAFIQAQDYQLWWHIPSLYCEENFYENPENIFKGLASFNMIALPKESTIPVFDLQPVVSGAPHPLQKNLKK